MKIVSIEAGTPAERAGLRPGDDLVAVNGAPLRDALDFTYHTADELLTFSVRRADGRIEEIELERDARGRHGIVPQPDPVRCCGNRCVFCFIDQNPPGLRPSLYVKDEDYRLSPFHGNYVTLTNLKPWEIDRIIEQHLDPLYVSVHATDPGARARLLGTSGRRTILPLMRRLGEAGIHMHTQIVLVPGYNDGAVLERTLDDLEELHPWVQTVAIVPVGLTRHRDGLARLRPVSAPEAAALLERVAIRGARCLKGLGTRLHFAADEFYLLAGRAMPDEAAYEGFPQVENGVGMVRAFERELAEAVRILGPGAARAGGPRGRGAPRRRAVFVTGLLFAPLLGERIHAALERTGEARTFDADVLAVQNRLFGSGVTVAGLLGGDDIAAALAECGPFDLAVLPGEVLNDDGVTLDHRTPDELAGRAGRPIQIGLGGGSAPLRERVRDGAQRGIDAMHLPVVAIVGRPNVGKSTFFNRVLHRRQAVVDDTPGVTRDRHAGLADWAGRSFFLVDTGGWLPGATEGMDARVGDQVLQALGECDAVLFLTDGREGLQTLDEEISRALRRLTTPVPVVLVVNKVDSDRWDTHIHEFASLGWETVLPVSSTEGRLVAEVLDALLEHLPERGSMPEPDPEGIRIAILGRPNVGKSSLTNRLVGEERVIVDPVPGTTRDAIDVPWRWHKRTFWLIDTAGIRHRWDHLPGFEFYASLRSLRALERADVALLILDATEKTSRQDQRVASLVEDSGKPVLILVNKWDAVEKDTSTMKRYEEDVREALTFLDYAPMLFISALTGQRSALIAEQVLAIHEAGKREIPTHEVNEVLRAAIDRNPARGTHGKRAPKILYGTQIRTTPPTFALFTRNPEGLGDEYTRYLGRRFREAFGFDGSPIRFKIRRSTGSTPARGRKRS